MADIRANELQIRRENVVAKIDGRFSLPLIYLNRLLTFNWRGKLKVSILNNVTKITKVISQVNELHFLSPLFKEFDRLYLVLRKCKMICSKLEIENVLENVLTKL